MKLKKSRVVVSKKIIQEGLSRREVRKKRTERFYDNLKKSQQSNSNINIGNQSSVNVNL